MKRMLTRNLLAALLLASLSVPSWSAARADGMTCAEPTPVTIDIKPGAFPNKINLSAKGLVPAAVLTTQDFDASQFAPEMAHLVDANTDMSQGCTGAPAVRWNLSDVNGDGSLDLVFFFRTQDLTFTAGTTAATLMAHGSYGGAAMHIMGTDSVVVKP